MYPRSSLEEVATDNLCRESGLHVPGLLVGVEYGNLALGSSFESPFREIASPTILRLLHAIHIDAQVREINIRRIHD